MKSQNIKDVGEAAEMSRGKGTKIQGQRSIGRGVGMVQII